MSRSPNSSITNRSKWSSTLTAITFVLGVAMSVPTSAGSERATPKIFHFDFSKSIRAHVANPSRFGDILANRIDVSDAGAWTADDGLALWQYAVKVPGAVNLGLYADDVFLPKGSTVKLIAGDESVVYSGDRFKRGTLITAAMPGDELLIELRVPAAQRATSRFQIQRFNVGYRSVDGSGPAHPAYTKLRAEWLAKQASATGADPKATSDNTACDINYRCELDKNSAIQELGDATVGIVFSGIGFCSGSLVMDVGGSFTPFVATAAHCIDYGDSPILSGDDGIIFSWKNEAPCGQALQPVTRDPSRETVGGVVRAQYQDGLLVEALDPPAWGANPWFGGWDATDATNYTDPFRITQPYCDPSSPSYDENQKCRALKEIELIGIHHGRAYDKQYVRSGLSRSDTSAEPEYTWQRLYAGFDYEDSNGVSRKGPDYQAWDLNLSPVPAAGRVMPGASGSALWKASEKRVIGNLSGGTEIPVGCPTNPNASLFASYQRFAVAYKGPAGATGANAFKFWLDPASTGISARDGSYQASRAGASTVSFTPDATTKAPNATLTLNWTTAKAGFCHLSGGSLSDHGVVANGSESVNVGASTGTQTYTLSCKNDAQVVTTKTVTVTVAAATPAPTLTFNASPESVWLGNSSTLSWSTSNATGCNASGAWSGTKSTVGNQGVISSVVGTLTYTLSCGGPGGTVTKSVSITTTPIPDGSSSGGSGGDGGGSGGGGALGPWALLIGLAGLRRKKK